METAKLTTESLQELLTLQSQCDHLRSELKLALKSGGETTELQSKLRHLESLLGRMAERRGAKMSKHGRLLAK